MDCSDSIDWLIEHLLTRKPSEPAIPDEIIEHIAGCRACIAELDALSTALTGEPSTLKAETDKLLTLRQPFDTAQDKAQDAACQECQAALPAYVEEQVAGEDAAQRYPEVAGHLQSCVSCREQYELLYEMLRQEEAGAFGETPSYMTFEEWIRKVPLETEPARPFWWDELGRLIIQFSADLVRALQPRADQPAYATVRSEKESRTLCQLSVKGEVEDLEVTITAQKTRDDPAQCTIVVDVDIPSRGGWPNLADTEVRLKRGELELDTRATDAFGKAIFEGISTDDLAHLVFEITPARET